MKMNRPPLLLHLRIPSQKGFIGLWLPWLLLYPVLLALMLLALPVIVALALILLPTGKSRMLLLSGPCLWRVLFAMRGLKLDMQTGGKKMLIDFI